MEAFEAPRKGWDHVGPIFIHIPISLPSPPIKWTATTKAAGPGCRLLPAVFSAQKFLRDAFRVVDFMTNLLRDSSSKPLNRIGVVLSWFALFHSEIHRSFFLHHKNWVLVYGTIFKLCAQSHCVAVLRDIAETKTHLNSCRNARLLLISSCQDILNIFESRCCQQLAWSSHVSRSEFLQISEDGLRCSFRASDTLVESRLLWDAPFGGSPFC